MLDFAIDGVSYDAKYCLKCITILAYTVYLSTKRVKDSRGFENQQIICWGVPSLLPIMKVSSHP